MAAAAWRDLVKNRVFVLRGNDRNSCMLLKKNFHCLQTTTMIVNTMATAMATATPPPMLIKLGMRKTGKTIIEVLTSREQREIFKIHIAATT